MEEEDLASFNLPTQEIVKENEIAIGSDPDFLLGLSFENIDKILRSSGFYFYEIPKSKSEINNNVDEAKSIYRDRLGNVLLLEYKFGILNVDTDFGAVLLSGIYVYKHAKLFLNILGRPQEVMQEVDLEEFLKRCPYPNVAYNLPTRIKKLIEENIKPRPKDVYV